MNFWSRFQIDPAYFIQPITIPLQLSTELQQHLYFHPLDILVLTANYSSNLTDDCGENKWKTRTTRPLFSRGKKTGHYHHYINLNWIDYNIYEPFRMAFYISFIHFLSPLLWSRVLYSNWLPLINPQLKLQFDSNSHQGNHCRSYISSCKKRLNGDSSLKYVKILRCVYDSMNPVPNTTVDAALFFCLPHFCRK